MGAGISPNGRWQFWTDANILPNPQRQPSSTRLESLNPGDDPYTKKLLARLNTDADAFEKADAEVRGQWTTLKTRSTEDAAELDELTSKVRALRYAVEYRVDADERVEFRQMLRTGSRRYVRHGNAEHTGAPAQTATPAATTTTQAAA